MVVKYFLLNTEYSEAKQFTMTLTGMENNIALTIADEKVYLATDQNSIILIFKNKYGNSIKECNQPDMFFADKFELIGNKNLFDNLN